MGENSAGGTSKETPPVTDFADIVDFIDNILKEKKSLGALNALKIDKALSAKISQTLAEKKFIDKQGKTVPIPIQIADFIKLHIKYPASDTIMFAPKDEGPFTVNVEPQANSTTSIWPMSMGSKLKAKKISNVVKVESRGRNRVAVTFNTGDSANAFLRSSFLIQEALKAYIPSHLISCRGIVRNIERDFSEKEILEEMRCADGIKIAKIERINRKATNEDGGFSYVPTNSVIVTFCGKRRPKSVYIYYNSRAVEAYVPRVIQCFGCLRYGHTKAICKSPAIRCPACAKDHPLDMCPDRDAPVCLHCGGKVVGPWGLWITPSSHVNTIVRHPGFFMSSCYIIEFPCPHPCGVSSNLRTLASIEQF